MARAKKAKSAEELSKSVNEATAAATENALRLAAEASNGPGSAEKAATIAQLARMCEEAADHIWKKNESGFTMIMMAQNMQPEIRDCWERFQAGEVDLDSVKRIAKIALPVLNKRIKA